MCGKREATKRFADQKRSAESLRIPSYETDKERGVRDVNQSAPIP